MLPKPTADAAAERTNINFPDQVARPAASVDDIAALLEMVPSEKRKDPMLPLLCR